MAENKLNLLADFPAISTKTWKEKIITDLKGADFDKKLVWRTPEGFNAQPFYRQEDLKGLKTTVSAPGQYPFVRGTKENNEWLVRQNICAKNAKAANAKALEILQKGVDSLGFDLDCEKLSYRYIKTLLEGIYCDCIAINFNICCPTKAAELANILVRYYGRKGYDVKNVKGSINVDPIKKMLVQGKPFSAEKVSEKIANVVKAAKSLKNYRVIAVNSVALNNAGAYCAQELGYALAWGAEYMNMLTEAGVPAYQAANAIRFNMGIGGNYFMEIAKFRAARMLWAMIVEQYKGEGMFTTALKNAAKMNVSAETSRFNMTVFDAYVNLLRSQTETMSAAIAGVDEIVVTPFDVTYEDPTDFAERIARNQQLLLKEECHFDKVVDPAAGSYYIENLTASIAAEAWKLFLSVQEKGGFYAMVASGEIQAAMQANLKTRLSDVAKRKETLLGTNQFPNFTEKTTKEKAKTLAKKAIAAEAACGCKCQAEGETLPTIPVTRAAEEFETLRRETECAKKQPVAFMLTIGNLAMRIARAQFSCNFLACAGYKVIDNNGFKTVKDGIKAARKAKADVIVLCSSDDEYAAYAPEAWKLINQEKELFIVAGAPACMEDLQKLGIENFIHVRCNVLDTLKGFQAKLVK